MYSEKPSLRYSYADSPYAKFFILYCFETCALISKREFVMILDTCLEHKHKVNYLMVTGGDMNPC
jgi:hypothetical protein